MGAPSARRVVIVDPGHSSSSGHHAEVNSQLLAAGRSAGLAMEIWVDWELNHDDPAFRPVLTDCGYGDPRHWLDLGGSLHVARRLRQQLEAVAPGPEGEDPVDCWIAHSLLPFQLIGLAQLLQHQPAARLEVGILYAPAERLAQSAQPATSEAALERQRQLAIGNARAAWIALAQAVQAAGHQLRVGCSSELQAALHQPLLAAAGLPPAVLQPAVVGAGWQPSAGADGNPGGEEPLVLLHWGDLKPGKGRQEALAVLEHLLAGGSGKWPRCRWLFHHCSSQLPDPAEQHLLQRAAEQLPGFQLWQGEVSAERMQAALAEVEVALLPYCPSAYAERSSGVLWCYGAARLATGRPARVVGHVHGWLAREARALGFHWEGLETSRPSGLAWLAVLERVLEEQPAAMFTAYGLKVLGRSYPRWLLADL
jgi:hypothetical protein